MVHKIVAGVFLALTAGAVVYGAVALARGEDKHSPLARSVLTQRGAEGTTPVGIGRGAGGRSLGDVWDQAPGLSDGSGQGQGARNWGQQVESGVTGNRLALAETISPAWETIEGTVTALHDLVITLDDGAVIHVGLGPDAYRQAAGFGLEIGQRLAVLGYEEDGEFKAGEVTNLTTGQSITLRDANGRPAWAGQGNGRNRQL